MSERDAGRSERRDRQVIRTEDLDDETLDIIRNVRTPTESIALNHLMDDSEMD